MPLYRIAVIEGGAHDANPQKEPFHVALRDFGRKCRDFADFQITTITCEDIRKNFSQPSDLIDFLLSCDAFFIICHIHQGIDQCAWNMLELRDQLQRLNGHLGFPFGGRLTCPVFLQNKKGYLKIIPEFSNNTMFVPITECGVYDKNIVAEISKFCEDNNEGKGWVVKAPYTTGGNWVKYPKTLQQVFNRLYDAYVKFWGMFNYVILQPCLINRRELKVTCLGGEASHICGYSKAEKGPKFANEEEVILFADIVIKTLIKRLGNDHWLEQMSRVDIMYSELRQSMVVNEIESLEAGYKLQSIDTLSIARDSKVFTFLKSYWDQKLHETIRPLFRWFHRKELVFIRYNCLSIHRNGNLQSLYGTNRRNLIGYKMISPVGIQVFLNDNIVFNYIQKFVCY